MKKENRRYRNSKFVELGEVANVSFLVPETNDGDDKIVMRVEEGDWKGTIVEVSKFSFDSDDSSSDMTFNMQVIYETKSTKRSAEFEEIIKRSVVKIIEYSIRRSKLINSVKR